RHTRLVSDWSSDVCSSDLGPDPGTLAMGVDPGLRGYQARYKLGVIYREQGRPAEAEAHWRAVAQERPDQTPVWLALGDLWLEQGREGDLRAAAAGPAAAHRYPG